MTHLNFIVEQSMVNAFMKRQDETRIGNMFIEYTFYPEPYFFVVDGSKTDIDPILSDGPAFVMNDYIKRYGEGWMVMMVKDISAEIEKHIERDLFTLDKNEESKLDALLDEIRHKVFEIGKPKMK